MSKIICIDFDGVIHSYSSGWKGVDVIPDPSVQSAMAWLIDLMDDNRFTPVIYSSRSKEESGIQAMKNWIYKWTEQLFSDQMAKELVDYLQFPTQKPAAFLTIDDRAICFKGVFPSLNAIDEFAPWHKGSNTKYDPRTVQITLEWETFKCLADNGSPGMHDHA